MKIMKLNIDSKYVTWIIEVNPDIAAMPLGSPEQKAAIENYVNEVLQNHKQSWELWEEGLAKNDGLTPAQEDDLNRYWTE